MQIPTTNEIFGVARILLRARQSSTKWTLITVLYETLVPNVITMRSRYYQVNLPQLEVHRDSTVVLVNDLYTSHHQPHNIPCGQFVKTALNALITRIRATHAIVHI